MAERSIYIVDTFGFLFRSFYALPPLYNRDGFPTGLLTGFIKTIQLFQKKLDINHLIFALEGESNFREEVSKDYKSNRGEAPDEFKKQVEIILSWIEQMNFPTVKLNNYEADDVIASLSTHYAQKGEQVYILSSDKDFIQLIDENISIIKPDKMERFGEAETIKKYGIPPLKFIDYQSLVGDSIDNVSGVKGIGSKSAEKLLSQFSSLDEIYNHIDLVTPKGVQKKLVDGKESAYQSKELVALKRDLDIGSIDFKTLSKEPLMDIVNELIKYELDNGLQYLKKMGEIDDDFIQNAENHNFEFSYEIITDVQILKETLQNIESGDIVAFDTETTGVDVWSEKIVGFSFTNSKDLGWYVPLGHNYLGVEEQISIDDIKPLMSEFKRFNLLGHNFKFDKHIIFNTFGVELPIYADTIILSWLENPSNSHSLDNLAYTLLKHKTIKFKDIVKRGEDFSSVDIDTGAKYAVEDVLVTLRLYSHYKATLQPELFEMGTGFEIRVSEILFEMESQGVKVDIERFKDLEGGIKKELERVKQDIFAISGYELNLNSPKQVAELLFDHLKIPAKKRSTDEMSLKSLQSNNPIISYILNYRELFKLISTYLQPLQSYGDVVRTTFVQTGTETGRLSSRNPNLQNIPVSSGVRNGFIANSGYTLISLDYSQIELRVLAHFSEEPNLIETFQNGEDIHSMVASKLNVERKIAKTVNFGILYGMGYKKLAFTLDIDDSKAKEILESYFQMFPALKDFQEREFQKLKENMYVETLLGRKRYFERSSSKRDESAIYREGFNTLFQGSSADIIKLAMVEIDREIKHKGLDAKLLLQIHDELIFEISETQVELCKEVFTGLMEKAYPLNIPLVVNSKVGKRWE